MSCSSKKEYAYLLTTMYAWIGVILYRVAQTRFIHHKNKLLVFKDTQHKYITNILLYYYAFFEQSSNGHAL